MSRNDLESARLQRFNELLGEEETSDSEAYDEWQRIIPREKYGEVSVTSPMPEFRKAFDVAIANGYVDDFLQKIAESEPELSGVFIAKANVDLLSDGNKKIATQHSTLSLAEISKGLEDLRKKVESGKMPKAFKNLYLSKIRQQKRFIMLVKKMGTPEFTRLQKTKDEWREFIDLDRTVSAGEVVLPYEQQALEFLEKNKRESKTTVYRDFTKVIEILQFSDEELVFINFSQEQLISTDPNKVPKLTAEQGKRMFKVFLNRVGLVGGSEKAWQVEMVNSSTSISVSASGRKISFPKSRELTPDEVLFICGHEMVHVLRGANGALQPSAMLQEGMDGYLETEEGLAILSEMILGQPFGHNRQLLFAARYHAVAMAMKVEKLESGEVKAKYSVQQIYDTIIDYGVEAKDAQTLVWRIFRGTSLQQKVVDLGITDSAGNAIQVCEVYAKDAVYFLGAQKIFEYARSVMPLLQRDIERSRISGSKDFSQQVLVAIGRAIAAPHVEADVSQVLTFSEARQMYEKLSELGRLGLLSILQHFLAGKMTFESLQAGSEWEKYLTKDRLIDYTRILQPTVETDKRGNQ